MNYDKLRALRDKSGLTIAEIAERSGVPEPTVKRIFGGKTVDPQFQTVRAIVKAMGGSLDEIAEDGITDDTQGSTPQIIHDPIKQKAETQPDHKDTKENLEMSEDTRILIEKVESTYIRLLEFKDAVIKQKDRWIYILAASVAFLVLGLVAWLGYDITHPNVGWFQY